MGNFKASPTTVVSMNADDLEVDSGTLSVDATNNRIGIGLTAPKTELTVEGTITLKEAANASSDTAAYGQLWVKSDAPCNLYFTDDTGQDVAITANGALAGVAGSLSGLGSTDNVILRANGTGGETAQGSGIAVDDSNNVSGMGTLGVGAITSTGALKIGSAAGSGVDAFLYTAGAAAHVGIQWDADGETEGILIGGADNHGVDFKFFGETSGRFVQWDMSGDELVLAAASKISFHDAGGGENIVASSNGHLEINSGTTLDMTAPTVDVNASTAVTVDTPGVTITDSTASSATEGGFIRLVSDDGAAMANDHRLGVLEFAGAEDANSTITVGAKIEAICDDNWSATENGTALVMSTTDANASQSEVLRLDSDKLATFAGAALFSGNATFGADDTGVDVRFFSATASEGLLYDASEDELGLLLTTKLSFHDIGGGENIHASSNGHLEINSGTTLDITAPTVDINASTAVTIDGPSVVIASATSAKPLVEIKNTNADGNGSTLQFTKDGTSVADSDVVGNITFVSEDDGDNAHTYASMVATVSDMTAGAEGGILELKVAEHDGTVTTGLKLQDGDADGEIDVTIGAGAASLVTVPGVLFLSGSSSEALRIAKDDDDAREIVFENGGADKAAIYLNSAENLFIRQEAAAKDINLRIASTNAVVVDGSASKVTLAYELGVGSAAGSGQDAYLYTAGTAAHVGIQWDADGETEGILIGGANDHGVDFKFFGETAGNFVHWDMSGDELVLAATSKISFHDAGGDENIVASSDGHLEVNAGTTLDMTAPTVDINASTAVTVDSDLVTFGSANANDPLVVIKNTTNDTASPRLRFVKDKGAAGADNDNIGTIEFYGDDDAQDNIEFASIGAQVADASNGAEGGRLVLRVATHDGEMQSGITIQDGDAEDEVDVTIGNGAASLTTIAGEMKVTEDFFQGDARRVIYQEVDVRKCDSTDNTVSVQFGNKIPQDSVVTRVVAIVKTASNLGTHNVNIRFDVGDGRAADYNAASTSSEALGGGASTTRSSTNVGSAVDIDLTAAKESYINDTPSFMTTADVYPYVMNAGTSNGTSDASSGTLLIYIEYYGIDQTIHFTTS